MITTPSTIPARVVPAGPRRRDRWQLVVFVLLAYGLSWWPAALRLLNPDSAPVLPIGPSIAAMIVVGWVYGRRGWRALLRSAIDVRIGRWWWGAAIPLPVAAAAAGLTLLSGAVLPSDTDLVMALTGSLIALPIVLIIGGPLGEELGWRGYLLPHFLRRHSPLTATVMLIPFWLAFHLPLVITDPGRYGPWWVLTVIGLAFTMTWLHLRSGGSVLLAIVFHTVANSASAVAIQLFAEADRPLAWQLSAALWTLTGIVIAAGPLRRTTSESQTQEGTLR